MMFFTSDLHLGHERVVEWRPFDSLDEMHSAIIDNWNSVVGEEDNVYILGDAVMGHRADNLPILKNLKGHKYLVPGNHDHVHPMHGEKIQNKWLPEYQKYLRVLPTEVRLISSRPFVLSHFPYDGDHTEKVRYPEWRPKLAVDWLLHGHIHGREAFSGPGQIDVGQDAWGYAPVSEDRIVKLIDRVAVAMRYQGDTISSMESMTEAVAQAKEEAERLEAKDRAAVAADNAATLLKLKTMVRNFLKEEGLSFMIESSSVVSFDKWSIDFVSKDPSLGLWTALVNGSKVVFQSRSQCHCGISWFPGPKIESFLQLASKGWTPGEQDLCAIHSKRVK